MLAWSKGIEATRLFRFLEKVLCGDEDEECEGKSQTEPFTLTTGSCAKLRNGKNKKKKKKKEMNRSCGRLEEQEPAMTKVDSECFSFLNVF